MRGTTGWWGVVLDAPDPPTLAAFYAELLGWQVVRSEPQWAAVAPDGGGTAYLAVQRSDDYVAPRWPARPGEQQMMLHLDVGVDSLDGAVAAAVGLGATAAEHQPQDDVRVMLDPAGHPFCLYLDRGE